MKPQMEGRSGTSNIALMEVRAAPFYSPQSGDSNDTMKSTLCLTKMPNMCSVSFWLFHEHSKREENP